MPPKVKPPSGLTITDPLIKYTSLVSTGALHPDPAQHRLAIHLQKLYLRLKDYTPSSTYTTRLAAITDALATARSRPHDASASLSTDLHPIRRNPLFARFLS